MKKLTLATMILLCPLAAHADPVSLALALSTLATSSIYLKIALVVASAAYGAYSSRRAQKKMAAAARAQHNAGLEDRTLTQFTSIPAWRVIYGRAVVGCEPLAMFTTDKVGTDDGGNSYTKVDGYKHIVMHVASHECHQFHDTIIAGVNVGPLTVGGWAQIWTENRTIAFTGSVQLPYDCLSVVSATDGTTAQTVTVSSDKRTLTGPSGVRVKVVYQAKRDDFSKGNEVTRTASITLSGGGVDTETVLETPTQIVNALHVTGSGDNIQFTDMTSAVSVAGNVITVTSAFLYGRVDVTYTTTPVKSSVRISYHLGTPGQVVDSYLNGLLPAKWTANHKLEGLTYAVITLDLEDSRFQGGPPQVSFDVSGRLLFDPRTSTTAFSDNSALVINDFLKNPWGYSCDDEDIDQDDLIQAANDCDVTTTFKEVDDFGITTTTTGPRYTTNGAFQTTDSREGVLDDLADSMAGDVVDGPRWSIRAGVWSTPVMDLDDDMLAGPLEIVQTDSGIDEVFNAVRGTFMAIGATSQSEFEPYRNSTMISADGEELSTDIALPFTNARARCTNIARIAVERSRGGLILTYPAQMPAWPLRVGERVRLTNDELQCTNKHFKITDWQNSVRTPVILTLHEDEPDFYDTVDSVKADPTVGINLPNPWFVPPVQNIVILSGTNQLLKADDGTVVVRAQVIWDPMTNSLVTKSNGRIEVWYQRHRISDDVIMDYQRAPAAEEGINYTYISGLNDGDIITVKVYAVNDIGIVSDNKFETHAVVGKSQRPADVQSLTNSDVLGGKLFKWSPNTEADYAATVVQLGSWSDSNPDLFRGRVSEYTFLAAPGSYTLSFKHVDSTGNYSLSAVSSTVTVTAGTTSVPSMEIAPEVMALTANSSGVVTDFSTGQATATVKLGSVDDTSAWTYSKVDTGVTSSLGGTYGNVVQVTGFDPALAYTHFDKVALQLHLDNNYTDKSKFRRVPSLIGTSLAFDTVSPVFGSHALRSSSRSESNCHLRYNDASLRMVGSFHLKFRLKLNSWNPNGIGFSDYFVGNAYNSFRVTKGTSTHGSLAFQLFVSSGAVSVSTPGNPITLNTWYAIEVSRVGTNLRLFVDGVLLNTSTVSASEYSTTDPEINTFDLFYAFNPGGPAVGLDGWIDELRLVIGQDGDSAGYTVEAQPFPDGANVSPGYVEVTATKSGQPDQVKKVTVVTTVQGTDAVTASLNKSSWALQSDYLGVVTDFSGASSTMRVLVGGVDDTANWTFSKTNSSGTITSSLSVATVTVSAFGSSLDSGYVEITGTRPGYPAQVLRFSLTKNKAPIPLPDFSISPSTMYIDAVASTGQVLSYSGKVWTVKVMRGSTDETSLWTISATPSLGSTVTVSNPSITLTNMPNGVDRDVINVSVSRSGYQTMQFGLQLLKNKNQPTPGLQVGSNFAQDAFGYATAGPATSGVKFSSDGGIYLTENGSTWSLKGYWYWPLTGGAGSSHTIDLFEQGPATLTTSAGASVSLASDRQYTLSRSTTGYEADNLRFRVYNGGGDYMWAYIMLEVQRT